MPYEAGTMCRSRMPKLNQVNWLIKTIQDINSQIQVARYHIQIARTRVQAWTETKNLKSSTQSNHIQIISQSQTEGLLTRHCSVLQLSPIVKSSPNIDYPIPRAQTITHIIVSFVPHPTIIANSVFGMTRKWPKEHFEPSRTRSECTSYIENMSQKNIWAKKIFFPMSTSRSGLRIKYHDIVRVRHNQKKGKPWLKEE